jgi:hypothetical protein
MQIEKGFTDNWLQPSGVPSLLGTSVWFVA